MVSPGAEILELFTHASNEIIIVAPFIKKVAFGRVLDSIPINISAIKCVTRWRPEEIAAGVSDVEIYDLIQSRLGAKLFIHPLLHAKYFRADERCLIGSSNLTLRALGWTIPANLELMIEAAADSKNLIAFEKLLFSASFEATDQLKREMIAAAHLLRANGSPLKLLSEESLIDDDPTENPADSWLPLCTRPDLLWQIYGAHNIDRIVGWTLEAGQRDIRALQIPPGLGKDGFYQFIAASILQTPLVQLIQVIAGNPITPENGKSLIESNVDEQFLAYSSEEHWNVIKEWLLHFLPRDYRQPSGSNNLQRGVVIGNFAG